MLVHYQIRTCLSGHSKFDMDWNLDGACHDFTPFSKAPKVDIE